ncbi:MAG TPA: signal recognition particle protein [bacterium]|nr:signal recognition particle protein [bacterium]
MFNEISEKLDAALKKIRGHGKISEKNVTDALKDVRIALLEADVNYKVVKQFTEDVKAKALGTQVLSSITPDQQFVKIVFDELRDLMGEGAREIALASNPPTVVMLVGLQGSGKTTMAAKLANRFRQKGRNGLLIAADVYRPAAVEQLETLGRAIPVEVYYEKGGVNPVDIAARGVETARSRTLDYAIVDTAGRLHVDAEMMQELGETKDRIHPNETILVADGMTGQEAVTIAKEFASAVGIDGVVLTKMDGDERGGAALSIKAVTGSPIRYVGVGEKLDALEVFHPERMASRILGMGDVLTLVEKAQDAFDAKAAAKLEQKILKETFSLEDFLDQVKQLKKMGPLQDLVGMIPGLAKLKGVDLDEKAVIRVEAVINSMTPEERRMPEIVDGSRRRRIARGSGVRIQDVNRLLRDFEEVRKMLKHVKKGGFGGLMKPFAMS